MRWICLLETSERLLLRGHQSLLLKTQRQLSKSLDLLFRLLLHVFILLHLSVVSQLISQPQLLLLDSRICDLLEGLLHFTSFPSQVAALVVEMFSLLAHAGELIVQLHKLHRPLRPQILQVFALPSRDVHLFSSNASGKRDEGPLAPEGSCGSISSNSCGDSAGD